MCSAFESRRPTIVSVTFVLAGSPLYASHVIFDDSTCLYRGKRHDLFEWLLCGRQLSPSEYKTEMAKPPSGKNSSTWGGALEIGIICKMYGCRILALERVQGGYEVIFDSAPGDLSESSMVGALDSPPVSIIFTGSHYNSCTLDPSALPAVRLPA